MGSGWFNLVLTLCAVRGFWQDYRGYEKAKLSWEGLAEGVGVLAGIGCSRGWRRYWALLGLSEPIWAERRNSSAHNK